jgi:hypothetical protein
MSLSIRLAGSDHQPDDPTNEKSAAGDRGARHLRDDRPYGRLNHFGHPDASVRRYYIDWFKTFADITAELGGDSVGSQFAIFTLRDYQDLARRDALIAIAIECWAEVAEHAKSAGLKYLFWEPMSVGREFGETIPACLALQKRLSAEPMALPMWMMADIDHGDVTSADPRDYDPYAWAEAVPATRRLFI